MSRRPLVASTAPIALVVLWSSGFIGAELGTRQSSASTLLAWRYLVAGMVLVAVCRWRHEHVDRTGVVRQAVLGAFTQVAYLGLVFAGVGLGASAGTTSLIASMQPLVVIALASSMLSERASIAQWIGLTLGIAGVALAVGGDLTTGGTAAWVYLLPIGGMLALSLGTVLQQRWRQQESLLVALTVQTVTAAVVFWHVALVDGTARPPATTGFWVAIAWTVVLSSFGGYGTYLYVSRTQGATRASTWLYLTPATTMLWAAVMFGDRVSMPGLAGLAVSAAGVALTVRRSSWRGGRCRRSRRRSRRPESSRSPTTRTARSPRAAPSRSPARDG
jgi:drug/metabolite transporter (DMT)-like permease